MQISKETIGFLKSFAQINQSIWVDPGNVIITMSPPKTVVAFATITEKFDVPFGIYDLQQFLGVVSLFDEPEFNFKEESMEISSGRSKTRYSYVAKNMLVIPPPKELEFPDSAVTFDISGDDMKMLLQSANVLGLPHICVESRDDELVMFATNDDESNSNEYSITVGKGTAPAKYKFRVDYLRIMPGAYKISISDKNIAKFKCNDSEVVYFIATEI
jgi:hypothetical protein